MILQTSHAAQAPILFLDMELFHNKKCQKQQEKNRQHVF